MVKCDNPDCECDEKCEDCTCDDSPALDNFFDGKKMAEIMTDADGDGGHLSYCYSNERAPKLWMKKHLSELQKVAKELANSDEEGLHRDMNKFLKVYVTNTVAMSQDVVEGMFSLLEFVELQRQMLEATVCFAKNHIMEVIKFNEELAWEEKILMIDCVAGSDFEKSSFIMGRKRLYEEDD